MLANFSANARLMKTILELKHLYNTTYTMSYEGNKVRYGIK